MRPPAREDPRRAIGAAGEDAAARWLEGRGLSIVARGFRSRLGEIDVIARDGPIVVFVEVKTRTGTGYGRPADAVTATKRARMAKLAALFLARSGWGERRCRFDVVEVEPGSSGWRVRHIPDAFRPGD